MATIGLLHGGSHTAWTWCRLVPELHARGHDVRAPTLPAGDNDAGLMDLADQAAEALPERDDLVLVGHSLSGTYLPLAAGLTDSKLMVFLCAMVPQEGRTMGAIVAEDDAVTVPSESFAQDDSGRSLPRADAARRYFYDDLPDELADAAVAHLVPQAVRPFLDVFPIGGWPTIPAESIIATDDRAVSPAWSRSVARRQLGRDAWALPGSHSIALSRPAELAQLLDTILARY
jgi:pimeloyl-ACP methyl ester carboxylesterase